MQNLLKTLFLLELFLFSYSLTETEIDFDSSSRPKPDDENTFYVPIFLTSDIHGYYYWSTETYNNQQYKYGGLDYLANYLTILREEFGEKRVLYLDGGDLFTGGKESEKSDGAIITDYLNVIKCDGATLGNHDYDYGKDFVTKIMDVANFSYLISNIYDPQTGSEKFHPKQESYKIFEIPTNNENHPIIKIGVIGTTYKFDKSPDGFSGVEFYDHIQKIIEFSDLLKKQNVDSVILLTHIGFKCKNQEMTYGIYDNSFTESDCGNEAENIMENLPDNTIDAILTSHSHKENHVFVNGIPVLSSTNMAKVSNVLYLAFDKENYKLNKNEVKIEGPLPACEKVFSKSLNCNAVSNKNKDVGELVEYKYHGKVVVSEPLLKNISETYLPLISGGL